MTSICSPFAPVTVGMITGRGSGFGFSGSGAGVCGPGSENRGPHRARGATGATSADVKTPHHHSATVAARILRDKKEVARARERDGRRRRASCLESCVCTPACSRQAVLEEELPLCFNQG